MINIATNNIYITEDEYYNLLNTTQNQSLLIGLLVIGICIYVIYRTIKNTRIELSSETPNFPPIKTLLIGIFLIILELLGIYSTKGLLNFGEVKTIYDAIVLILSIFCYFLPMITGIILVISYIKREKHYKETK